MKASGNAAASRILIPARLRASRRASTASKFSERSVQAADAAGHAEHFVARLESGHARARGLNDAGDINAEDRRQRLLGMRRTAGADLGIQRIDASWP